MSTATISAYCIPHNIGLLGLPHSVTEDDEYLGYRIPAGSTVIANIWFGDSLIVWEDTILTHM